MGTAANQVMTKTDVNNKRSYSFKPGSTECIIKNDCSGIDFLNITSSWPGTKCVINSAFSVNITNLTFYYGIHNNKSSNAKLDYVVIDLSTSSSATSGTWYEIGRSDPGSVSSYKRGTISCDLTKHPNFNINTHYYVRARCGNSNFKQTWYWDIGDRDNFSLYSMANATKNVDRITTRAIQLQHKYDAYDHILTSSSEKNLDSNVEGRSAKRSFLFALE